MDAPTYLPRPIDSSAVSLSADLDALTEKLAENAHDLWARERIAQGWTWGEQRDDTAKKHPCLVSYAKLPDAEKKFDRETAMGTVKAMLAMGTVMETPPQQLTSTEEQNAKHWEVWLDETATAIEKNPSHPRGWDFDMDDQPELDSGRLAAFPTLHAALEAFQKDLVPVWKKRDTEANETQKRHRRIARFAIFPGVLAILLAIIQLALHEESSLTCSFSVVEFLAAVVAAVAVGWGYSKKTRDRWLAARQAAERLRVVKFRALADPQLWCDFNAWSARWRAEVEDLSRLDFQEAEHWVHSGCAEPTIPGTPSCPVTSANVRAIADYYRVKRQRYQGHYFVTKAGEHQRDLWLLHLRLPVCLFFLSVAFVISHVIFELPTLLRLLTGTEHSEASHTEKGSHVLVTIFLALAAALPVVGFCLRAWFSAFELPRRAQLFAGKAAQLKGAIERVTTDRLHARKTFTHIELSEHFFENEHREWCRLILEAEWFV